MRPALHLRINVPLTICIRAGGYFFPLRLFLRSRLNVDAGRTVLKKSHYHNTLDGSNLIESAESCPELHIASSCPVRKLNNNPQQFGHHRSKERYLQHETRRSSFPRQGYKTVRH